MVFIRDPSSAAPVRWADIDSDNAEVGASAPSASRKPFVPKLRWADMFSDDECDCQCPPSPASTKTSVSGTDCMLESECSEVEDVPEVQPSAFALVRPRFVRPTRQQRVQQVYRSIDEFLNLDFDSVAVEEQSGVVQRMLAVLKALHSTDVYWTELGERGEEERYALLGFQEKDMRTIGQHAQQAEKHLENRSFRKAFDSLCDVRPFLRSEASAGLRTMQSSTQNSVQATKQETQCEQERKQANHLQTAGSGSRAQNGRKRLGKEHPRMGSDKRSSPPVQETSSYQHANKGNAELKHAKRGRGGAAREAKHKPAPSGSAAAESAQGARGANLQCQFFIGIDEERRFGVVRRVLGSHGANMKRIATQTGSRLRLRGRGSGFLEGPAQKEASDPLMLCVSAPDVSAYHTTKGLVSELLEEVYEQYRHRCRQDGQAVPDLRIRVHEGYRQNGR